MNAVEWTPPDPTRPARAQRLGASEAAGAMGLSKFANSHPMAVWARKVGLAGEKFDNQVLWLGRELEPAVRDVLYVKETGRLVIANHKTYRSRDRQWLTATPDGICIGEPRGVEAKTAAQYPGTFAELKEIWASWGKAGTAEIPYDYQIQCQVQMYVCDLPVIDVPALIGGRGFSVYTVERNDRFIGNMLGVLDAFWEMVTSGRRPDPDWSHPDCLRLISQMAKPRAGVVRKVDARVGPLVTSYESATESERRVKKIRAQAKAHLEDALGDAERAELPDGRVVVRSVGSQRTIKVLSPAGIVVGDEGEVEE